MKQIVISVPDEWLEGTQPNLYDVMGAVMNGTVLPEHHGRLIDADEYIAQNKVSIWLGQNVFDEYLEEISVDAFNENTPTIIPATREKSCENCANLNKHTGCLKHIECQRGHLKYFEPKQTATKEGDGE